jgi:hypothetical protein
MSTAESLKNKTDDQSPNEWEQVAKLAKQAYAEQVERAPEQATMFFKSALSVEKDFDRRRQAVESNGDEMTQKEFEEWEDALSDEIGCAENELRKTDYTLETIAECERAMTHFAGDTELYRTIEAQAGRFYHERISNLREAIQSSGDKQAQEELDYIKGFYNTVMVHLDYKYMTRDEIIDFGHKEYEDSRTLAHNNAIKHLNGLNELAKKYHVRPLTVRNFWPSDLREEKKQTAAVREVMQYDRHSVEGYYATAFSSEVQRREYIRARKEKYGIN